MMDSISRRGIRPAMCEVETRTLRYNRRRACVFGVQRFEQGGSGEGRSRKRIRSRGDRGAGLSKARRSVYMDMDGRCLRDVARWVCDVRVMVVAGVVVTGCTSSCPEACSGLSPSLSSPPPTFAFLSLPSRIPLPPPRRSMMKPRYKTRKQMRCTYFLPRSMIPALVVAQCRLIRTRNRSCGQ